MLRVKQRTLPFSTKQQLDNPLFDGDPLEATTTESAVHVAILTEDVGVASPADADGCQLVLEQMFSAISVAKSVPIAERLAQAVQQANAQLLATVHADDVVTDSRVTAFAAAVVDGELHLARVGNSDAYLIRDGKAYLLTVDHTWAHTDQRLLVDVEQATTNDAVPQWLGTELAVVVDNAIRQPTLATGDESVQLPRLNDRLPLPS